MRRRSLISAAGASVITGGLTGLLTGPAGAASLKKAASEKSAASQTRAASQTGLDRPPILVTVELSGGNDGLNSIVPFADDAYYRHRPTLGIPASKLLTLDDHFGFNPGMLGLQRLWESDRLAIVHGCGYEQPSYSHFTSMAYWHTAKPNSGSQYGWLGGVADALSEQRQDDMIINIAPSASLAVNSRVHTPVVFDDPDRFAQRQWMGQSLDAQFPDAQAKVGQAKDAQAKEDQVQAATGNREFLNAVRRSATASSNRIRAAWRDYSSPVDYGIAPMDLPKVAACIDAGLPTQLYHVSFRNNAFDTHVAQPALHQRLLSYACDGIYGFIQDLARLGHADRVLVLVYSEFGRRVPQNANMGTDHGSANVMFLAGAGVKGGHYGEIPSLTELDEGDNLLFTTDFRRVYATAMQGWLGVSHEAVLGARFEPFDLFV